MVDIPDPQVISGIMEKIVRFDTVIDKIIEQEG